MPRNAILEVKDNNLIDTIRGFLRSLLEKGLLDAMLVPVEVPSRKNVVQTVVTGIDGLDNANPLAPVMPVNSAKIVSSLTKVAPSKKKIGLVLRSCELRALTELVKLKQADLTNLLLIGIDCFGAYSVSDYGTFCQENDSPTEKYLKKVRDGNDSLLRQSCRICCHPVPLTADITIGLIGMDLDREIMVQGSTEAGEEMLEALDLGGDADPSKRDESVSKLGSEREKQRDEFLKTVQEEVEVLRTCSLFLLLVWHAITAVLPVPSVIAGSVCLIRLRLWSGKLKNIWTGPKRRELFVCPLIPYCFIL